MIAGLLGTVQRSLYSLSLVVGAVSLFVGLSPTNLFGDFHFKPQPLERINYSAHDFTWNTNLVKLKEQRIYGNAQVVGPESIAVAPGSNLWYTGSADGYIKEIEPNSGKIRNVLRHRQAPECEELEIDHAHECGRYLQLRFHQGHLYAIEANSGLYLIDIERGTKTLKAKTPFKHHSFFYNSFAFDPKQPDLVYITVSSARWDLQSIMWSFLENERTGYIFAYHLPTGKAVRLLDRLAMVNGVDVDAKADRLLFTETMAASVSSLKLQELRDAFASSPAGHSVKGLKATPLIGLLPGNPDNVMVQGDTAWVAVPLVQTPVLEAADYLMQWPSTRSFIAKFFYMLGKLCDRLNRSPLGPNSYLGRAHREMVSGLVLYKLFETHHSAVIEYNLRTGEKRLHGSDLVAYVSEAQLDHQGNLILGSFRNSWIQLVPYSKWQK